MCICIGKFSYLSGLNTFLFTDLTVSFLIHKVLYFCLLSIVYSSNKYFTDVYPSSYEEWQSVECILGLMNVFHAFIGAQQYKGRTNTQLAAAGVFFYDHFYEVDFDQGVGKLVSLGVPEFISNEWPLPSSDISEGFRLKLFQEVQKALKGNIATRLVKIKVCMPLCVFVDFFALSDRPVKLNNTMLVCKNVDASTMLEVLDKGWDIKNQGGITCRVHTESINVKYMIKTQNFIMSFSYQRSFYVNGVLTDLDHDHVTELFNSLIEIDVWMDNELQTSLIIGRQCTVQQLRLDLVAEDEIDLPDNFKFMIDGTRVRLLQT